MEKQDKLQFFRELISVNQPIYASRYSAGGALLESDCPKPKTMDAIFRAVGYHELLFADKGTVSIIFSHENGLTWLADKEIADGEPVQAYVFGPFYANLADPMAMEKLLKRISEQYPYGEGWKDVAAVFRQLPTLPSALYMQYAVMLHYCLSGQRISVNELRLILPESLDTVNFSHLKTHSRVKDRLPFYRAENALLHFLTEGDLNYRAAQTAADATVHVPQYTDDALQNQKLQAVIFASRCVHAAIAGGLSASLSYALGDAYIKTIWMAHSAKELSETKRQMFDDFVQRIHSGRKNEQYSPMVQSCCDFIRLHFAEPVNIEMLAARLGYAKYYLSAQFKKEVGVSVNDYLKSARVERAKVLLTTTDRSIEEIALDVGFSSRVFFERIFRQKLGTTPLQFRAKERPM